MAFAVAAVSVAALVALVDILLSLGVAAKFYAVFNYCSCNCCSQQAEPRYSYTQPVSISRIVT